MTKHSNQYGIIAAAALTLAAGSTSAQSATALLTSPSTAVAPGQTVPVTLVVQFDTAGAPAGEFGAAGFYGFGGDVLASGTLSGELSASAPALNPLLGAGPYLSTADSPALVRAAAGRGFDGGLQPTGLTALSFDVEVGAGATDGSATLGFDGAVVLVLGDALVTFSTNPGPGQFVLSTTDLVLTVESCVADLTTINTNPGDAGYGQPDGQVDGADLSFFVEAWLGQNTSIADLTTINTNPGDAGYGQPDGNVDGADLSYYIEQWLAGCA